MKRRSAARIGVNSRDPDHRGDVGDNRPLITDQTQGLLSRGSQGDLQRLLSALPVDLLNWSDVAKRQGDRHP